MARDRIGRFRSTEAEARFEHAYANALATWPLASEPLDVPTGFGTTRVNACGPSTGTPIVLLHALMATSTSWAPNVAALAQAHPVFAVDTICDAGRSVQERAIRGGADLAAWLDDVLAGLEIGRAHVVGLSFGSWIGINQALRSPARLASVTAIEPPGVITRGKLKLIVPFVSAGITRSNKAFERLTLTLGAGHLPPAPIFEVLRCGFRDFKLKQPFAELLKDDQLRAIATPMLLLFGERSPMSYADRAVERARRVMPNVEAEVVPGVAHTPTMENPELLNRRILQFVDGVDGAPR